MKPIHAIALTLVLFGVASVRGATCTPSEPRPDAILIDDAWLAARGAAPWFLDRKSGYYRLTREVIANGTAFVVAAENVTLDLGCQRIIYGNGRPTSVRNGGFEEVGDGIPGWSIEGPGKVAKKASQIGMWGNTEIEITELDGGKIQRLESEPISLPEAPREYAALVTPKGPSTAKVRVFVVDARTRAVLATGDQASTGRGFASIALYTAKATGAVRLRIEVTGPGPLSLDYASFHRSRDFGIVATPSSWNLPEPLKSDARVIAAGRVVRSFTLKNGRVHQGWGAAYGGSSLFAIWATNTTVENVHFISRGDDANVVEALGAASFRASSCVFEATATRISNRMKLYAGLNLSRAHGTIAVENSSFEGLPQCGVVIARQRAADAPTDEAQKLTLVGNSFRLNALGSDAYAIVLVGVRNFLVAKNRAIPLNGRGLLIDGFGEEAVQDGEIRENEFHAYERPNLEYGPSGLDATALRIRNWANGGAAAPDKGAVRRLSIHHNKFIARTDRDGVGGAIGARVSFRNDDGRMDRAGNVFTENLFRATTSHLAYFASALSFSGVYAGVENRFDRNTFESNHVGIQFGDRDSYRDREEEITISDSVVRRLAGPVGIPYAPFAKLGVNAVRAIRLLNLKNENGVRLPEAP